MDDYQMQPQQQWAVAAAPPHRVPSSPAGYPNAYAPGYGTGPGYGVGPGYGIRYGVGPGYGRGYDRRPAGPDGFAIASLVCGLVLGLGSLPAVVLGHVSQARSRRAGRRTSGLAVTGLILGYVGLTLLLLAVAIPVFLGERQQGYSAVERSDLRNVANAEESYYTDHGTYADLGSLSAPAISSSDRVRLVSATSSTYCLAARTDASARTWYYSSSLGLSTTPCG